MIEEVIVCAKARIPVVWLETYEESRAEGQIVEFFRSRNGEIFVWSLTSSNGNPGWGFPFLLDQSGADLQPIPFDKKKEPNPPLAIHDFVEHTKRDGKRMVAIIRDPYRIIQKDARFIRALRDAAFELQENLGMIICITPC